MLDRRGFLGSIIGFLSIQKLPFKAVGASYEAPTAKTGIQLNQLDKYRLAVHSRSGEVFWAPGWEDISRNESGGLVFKAEGIDWTYDQATVFGCTLINQDGRALFRTEFFHGDITMLIGDKLVVSYTVNGLN